MIFTMAKKVEKEKMAAEALIDHAVRANHAIHRKVKEASDALRRTVKKRQSDAKRSTAFLKAVKDQDEPKNGS